MRVAIASTALLIVTSAVAFGATGPSGSYTAKITNMPKEYASLDGTWTIGFAAKGQYTLTTHKTVVVRGRYSVKRHRVTIRDLSGTLRCSPPPGIYDFARKGSKLTLMPISDDCHIRHNMLNRTFHAG